jgi:hypothetical protein
VQAHRIQNVIHAAIENVSSCLIFENAFLDHDDHLCFSCNALCHAAHTLGYKAISARLSRNVKYLNELSKVVSLSCRFASLIGMSISAG